MTASPHICEHEHGRMDRDSQGLVAEALLVIARERIIKIWFWSDPIQLILGYERG